MIVLLSDVKLSEKPRARFARWLSRSCGFFVNGHWEAALRISKATCIAVGRISSAMKRTVCAFVFVATLATGEIDWFVSLCVGTQ
jgi:hypothetical protein